MPRPRRFIVPGGWFHVMNRGANHQGTYLSGRDHTDFFEILTECRKLFGLECHAYCLMTNHYHLLIRTPSGDLPAAMHRLDGLYTQAFNRRHRRDGPLFRGRYKSVYVDSEAQLLRTVRYIHLNPVEANIVDKAPDFQCSSYAAYLGGAGPDFLRRETVWSLFGTGLNAIRGIEAFTNEGIDDETRRFYSRLRFPAQRATDSTSVCAPPPAVRRRKIDALVVLAASRFAASVDAAFKGGKGCDNRSRRLAILLCRLEGHRTSEIARALGVTPNAVTNAFARAVHEAGTDPEFRGAMTELRQGEV